MNKLIIIVIVAGLFAAAFGGHYLYVNHYAEEPVVVPVPTSKPAEVK